MGKVKNKLKSENGVSILFALLLLIVVAMVSVTMVSASITAVKRTHSRKNNEQNSILLDSAALLLKDNIPRTVTLTYSNDTNAYVCSEADYGIFAEEIKKISEAICNDDPNNSMKTTGELTFQVDGSKLKDIHAKYSIDTSSASGETVGTVIFHLTVADDPDENREYVKFNLTRPSEDTVVWNFEEITAKGGNNA